jgi:TonB family protein
MFLFILAAAAAVSMPQTPLGGSPSPPADPRERMVLAAHANNLTAGDIKPWRLEADFAEIGADGKPGNPGTFEEFWAGTAKFKRILTSPEFTIVEYGTPQGVVRVGGAGRDDWQLTELHNAFAEPLPQPSEIDAMEVQLRSARLGDEPLDCIDLKPKPTAFTAPLFPTQAYCFDAGRTFLRARAVVHGANSTAAGPITFQDRLVPGDVAIARGAQLALRAHIRSLDLIPDAGDALFTPPHSAETVSGAEQVELPNGTAENYISQRLAPVYPPIAKAARVQGTVVLQVLIGKDGSVQQIGVLSGPPLLQQAAIDAVRQWVYKPYRVKGKAVLVETTVNVIFTLAK